MRLPTRLHYAKEVDHLVAERGKVSRRGRRNLAGDTAETFLDELLERPTGAITGEHGKVVNVNLRFAVRLCDFFVIDFAQPIVCRHCARVGKDKTADGVRHGGVFLHTPVVDFEIVVDGVLVVEHRGVHLAKFFVLFSVKNVCLRHFYVARLNENHFHCVLNVFNAHAVVFHLVIESCRNAQSKHIDDVVAVVFAHRVERFFDCDFDFVKVERNDVSVSFLMFNIVLKISF